MEWNLLTIVAILILAVCGFVFLSWTLLSVWGSLDRRKGSLFRSSVKGRRIEEPYTSENCFDDCMRVAGWDSAQAASCSVACKV